MKSSFVTLFGRPSSGKSTIVNKICVQKVSIVSATPQTTRNIIRGIYTCAQGQLVFLDTPGYHLSDKKINLQLKQLTEKALSNAEIILYVVDCSRKSGQEEEKIIDYIAQTTLPVVAALNKTDLLDLPEAARAEFLTESINFLKEKLKNNSGNVTERKIIVVPVSAKTGDGIDALASALFDCSQEGELFYPDDMYTDQDAAFRISEIIREKAVNRTSEEIPHSIYVEIADMQMVKENGKEIMWVRAFLLVESESQKGIVIGSGGEKIKAIRLAAKKEIKGIFPYPVQIDLRVKVNKNWRKKGALLNSLIR